MVEAGLFWGEPEPEFEGGPGSGFGYTPRGKTKMLSN